MFKKIVLSIICTISISGPVLALPIVDFSALPINDGANGFGSFGGLQFLNQSTFAVGELRVLLGGSTNLETFNLSIVQFDGGVGDTTATGVLGTLFGLSGNGTPYDVFADDAVTADFSALNITLQAATVYGIVGNLVGINGVRGGSTAAADTTPLVGTIFNGSDLLTYSSSLAAYEIPFTISAANTTPPIPAPATVALFGLGLAGLGWSRRKKA